MESPSMSSVAIPGMVQQQQQHQPQQQQQQHIQQPQQQQQQQQNPIYYVQYQAPGNFCYVATFVEHYLRASLLIRLLSYSR